MKQYYANSTLFIISLIFSKIKSFRDVFVFGDSVKKAIFVLFLILMQANCFAQTKTYNGPSGSWNVDTNWSPVGVPTSSDDVVIPSGKIVTITANSYAKSVSISGTLDINSGNRLTVGSPTVVNGNFTVNSGGRFTMTDGKGTGLAELAVYGNYINNGATDFWKSTVVIAGNLLSPATSVLQKQGNVIVGGDIIGNFDTTGGDGSGQIYSTDPNATVQISPPAVDVNVIPGVFPSSENQVLIDLVNLVIYGGTCPFTVNNIANVSACSGSNATFSVSTNASPTSYKWQVNTNGSGWVDLINDALYSGVSTATLYITGVTVAMNGYKYRAKITAGSPSCTKNGNYGVLTVNPLPATPTASVSAQPTCAVPTGTIAVASPAPATGITYTVSGASPVVVAVTNATGVFSGLAAGNYSVTTTNAGGCTSLPTALTVSPQPPAPTAPTFALGDIIQPTCVMQTASVTLSGLPVGTWTLTRSPGAIVTSGSGTTTTISGLAAGSYNFTVSNLTCTSLSSGNVVISPIITNIWTGSWSTGFVPTIDQNIQFNVGFSQNIDLVGCSCEVKSGIVTIASGKTMTLTNGLTVSGGSLTFENNASLVQVNGGVTNIGNITYKRQTSIIRNSDYTYWSTPVNPQTLINVSPNTALDKFYSFNAATDSWVPESPTSTMIKGKGYIIRGPSFFPSPNPPSGIHQASFIGVPNNGDVSISITTNNIESSYLIGNPYPSALDANSFINANSSVIDGTLYFWTHNTAITNNQYTSDDYASYNLTGGAATTSTIGTVADSKPSGTIPTGKIGSGQGFFVTSIAAGNIVFNNSMRVGVGTITGSNYQFFKIKGTNKIVSTDEKHRVWLNLRNSQGAFKQTLVGYITGATNDYDNLYDGESFDANEFIDFYSVSNDKKLVIQGRALPFEESDIVALGYRSAIAGDFTIGIDQVDGLLADKVIYLKDNTTNTVHNLNESAYSFKTETGTFNNRFTLRYTNTNKTLANEDFELAEYGVLISSKNKELRVNSSVENIDKVLIYDMSGRQVYKNTNVNNKDLVLRNIESAKQILLVKVELQNGQSVTQKIVY